MRRVVSYSILVLLSAATIGTGIVVATVFGSTGLPEADGIPTVTATPTSATQVLPTTTPVASQTPQHSAPEPSSVPTASPAQLPRPLTSPTMAIVPTPTDEASPTITTATPSLSAGNDADYIEYTVQSGDLLYTIALEYNVTVEDILAINTIENPDNLTVGSVIRVPR